MKKLVLTIAIGDEYQQLSKLTHPTLKAYADKIGADFHVIDKIQMSKSTPHWEKFQIYDWLKEYDRIAYIDTDIIIRDDAPDLFEIVPYMKLGMFNEGRFTQRGFDLIYEMCKAYNVTLPEWNGAYYNSGVMVISNIHKELFKKPDKEIGNFFEQSYLNMKIAQYNVDIAELEYKFNRMTCMDKFTGEERHASYFIHYAGWYWKASEIGAPSNLEYILDLVQKDLNKWKKDRPHYKYKNHIYVSVSGGYGDQLCAEPAIRYMISTHYPNDEVVIATHAPRFFEHLKNDNVKIIEHGKFEPKDDIPYYITKSLPGPEEVQWAIVSHLLCHTVDYSAIALLKRTLPFPDREIKFEVKNKEYKSLYEKTGTKDLKDYIVIHPGKHWESKTFPDKWWQEIIDGLKDYKTVLVGKTDKGDPPLYKAGARGTVNVKGNENTIDLRDKINFGEFAALLSKAKVLISNDSFPIHLAGAFDNHIILIPSCKHPDHILPYRNGSVYYKAKALYKKLIIDELESKPTQMHEVSADVEVEDWNKYLLTPEEVVAEIIEINHWHKKGEEGVDRTFSTSNSIDGKSYIKDNIALT